MAKEKIIAFAEILAVGSITAIGLALGGPIGAAVIAGLGINLGSNIVQSGSNKLKEQWLTSSNGILNHDIQHALARAYIKALESIQKKYFEISESDSLPKNEKKSIKALFKELIEQAQETFLPSLEKAITENEIKTFLYDTQQTATDLILQRINKDELFSTYNEPFREYFKKYLLKEVQFWFAEELKTDNKDCNKAWRAFQRLLLEGIQADIKSLKVGQDLIHNDLQILNILRKQIEDLKERAPNEPFQQGLDHAINEMQQFLKDMYNISFRTEKKIDAIATDVKNLLDQKTVPDTSHLDEEIKPLLEEIKEVIDSYNYDKAEKLFEQASLIAKVKNDEYSIARLQKQYARIVKEKYFQLDKAEEILIQCLHIFEKYNSYKDISSTKEVLAQIKASLGDLNGAEIYATDNLEYVKTTKDYMEIASAYITLGFINIEKHQYKEALKFMDEAIQYGTRLSQNAEKKDKENGIYLISLGNHNKSFIYKRIGNLNEAKSCCLKAIEGHRKLEKKQELGKILFEMTEIECYEGNFSSGQWKKYIEEAKSIFREIKDYSMLARCIDLVSRIAYTSGEKKLSLEIFKQGYEEIKKSKDKEGIAYYLEQFVSFFIMQKKFEDAEIYLKELIEYAETNKLNKSIIRAYEDLANIADKKGNISKRNEYLDFVIKELEKEYNQEQSEAKKANILGKIGDVHTHLGNLRESLATFEKVSSIYERLNEVAGFAKATLIVAELNMQLGNRAKAFENWLKVSEIVKGTAFYEFATIAKINSGSFLIRTGDYETAQRHLEEAQYLILKYKLQHLEEVEYLLREIKERKDLTNPSDKSFSQMIHRLYEGINNNKEIIQPLLRYWYSKNEKDLYKHFYNITGVRSVLYTDDLNIINDISKKLSWLFDYYLIMSNEKFDESSYETFTSPYNNMEANEYIVFIKEENAVKDDSNFPQKLTNEDKLLEALNKPAENGSLPRYLLFPTKIENEIKVVVGGWSRSLPKIAYDFIRTKTADKIISGNIFFSNIDRSESRDKYYSDLLFCWQLRYMPIYINEELTSEDVRIIGKINIDIPINYFSDKNIITAAKKIFNSLFTIEKEKISTSLNNIKYDLDSLFAENKQKISITLSFVEFEYVVKKIIYPIINLNYKK